MNIFVDHSIFIWIRDLNFSWIRDYLKKMRIWKVKGDEADGKEGVEIVSRHLGERWKKGDILFYVGFVTIL